MEGRCVLMGQPEVFSVKATPSNREVPRGNNALEILTDRHKIVMDKLSRRE